MDKPSRTYLRWIKILLLVITVLALLFVGAAYGIFKLYKRELINACAGEEYVPQIGVIRHNAPDKETCQGKKIANLKTGTYRVGDTTFRIPRAYLWQQKFVDGDVDAVYMQMFYPSLKPISREEEHNKILFDALNIEIAACPKNPCNLKSHKYRLEIETPKKYFNPESKPIDSKPEYLKNFGMWKYTSTFPGKPPRIKEIYYKGDKENPDYWFLCTVSDPNPYCVGDYWISKRVSVSIRFHISLIKEHQKIHDTVQQKIQSFVQEK